MLVHKSTGFKEVFEYFENRDPYEELFSKYLQKNDELVSEYISILGVREKDRISQAIRSFSKNEIEYILFHAKKILEGVTEDTFLELIKSRYRRYVFRSLYILWQDNYENEKIRRLFLAAIDNPQTSGYVEEINFDIKTLRDLVVAVNTESRMIDFSRLESLDMKEFLAKHKIHRKTILGIDVLSIFFLFCSADDFIEFGSERLLIAIKRYELANQAKILNNMISKLNKEQMKELSSVIEYLLKKYPHAQGRNSGFWVFISPESAEILKNNF